MCLPLLLRSSPTQVGKRRNIIQLTVTFTTCEIFKIYRQAILSPISVSGGALPPYDDMLFRSGRPLNSHTHIFRQHCLFNGLWVNVVCCTHRYRFGGVWSGSTTASYRHTNGKVTDCAKRRLT
uniref:Uncharacterized protein n=1 Tax=Aedes aegypti TaxID=7159 RepID=Q1HRI8_AEDAE|nr:unknown [Aedes aegypti]